MVTQRPPHRHNRHFPHLRRRKAHPRNRKSSRRKRPPHRPREPSTHVRPSFTPFPLSLSHTLTNISYVSPRTRAQRTLELLDLGCSDRYPWDNSQQDSDTGLNRQTNAHVEITEAIREWDYGDYEGKTSATIRQERADSGLDTDWDIWRDGCPGGESPVEVTKRLDALIASLREKYHADKFGKESGWKGTKSEPNDVLIVAHGHILRAFAARWVGKKLEDNPSLILEAGGVGTLSYEHHRIEEPAILLGGAFVVDVLEKEEEKQ